MAMESLWGEEYNESAKIEEVTAIVKKANNPKDLKVAKKDKKREGIDSWKDDLPSLYEKVKKILKKQLDNVIIIRDINTYNSYIDKAIECGVIGIDTETNMSLDPTTCIIVGLCLYVPDMKQAYIPINHVDFDYNRLPNQLNEKEIAQGIKRLIDAKVYSILSNAKFDYQVISAKCDEKININWDTQICARMLNENISKDVGLKELYTTLVDRSQIKYDIESLFEGIPNEYIDPYIFGLYSATDPMMSYKVKIAQEKDLSDESLSRLKELYETLEIPLIQVTAEMELAGVEVDVPYSKLLDLKYQQLLDEVKIELDKEFEKIQPQIDSWKASKEANYKPIKTNKKGETVESKSKREQLKDPIDVASPIQVAILLYDILKAPIVNEEKPRATGEEEIEAIYEETGWSICKVILRFRELNKLLTTYIRAIPNLAMIWDDHRVRTHFNQLGTDTGRYSSGGKIKYVNKNRERIVVSGLNLQNIPSHNKEIRMLFKAKDGCVLVGSDFSAQEPRLTAFYSQDKELLQIYYDNKDAYAEIAVAMYGNKYEDNLEFYPEGTKVVIGGKEVIAGYKTILNPEGKERRGNAKILLLAILYGMSAKSVGISLGKSTEEGQRMIDNFYKRFKGVKAWIDKTEKFAKEHLYVEDWRGRRFHLDELALPKYEAQRLGQQNDDFNPYLNCEERLTQDDKLIEINNRLSKCNTYKEMLKVKNDATKEGLEVISNGGKISKAQRKCVNSRVQGGASTLTKMAMLNIFRDKELNDLGFRLLITVHDEVLGECPEENGKRVAERLVEVMTGTAKDYMNVPMKCDPYIVKHWYEDEMGANLIKEYKKNQLKFSDEESLKKVIENHIELPERAIKEVILEGKDLSF